ncbi:MAG: hypothetical protein CM15mV115_300 [Caudoviricetes sp.]|nr:MAG: hypothetical protein CM15mV115_300 [Caudoviricetes sp.]
MDTITKHNGPSKRISNLKRDYDRCSPARVFCAIQYKIEAQDLQFLKYGTSSAETITLKFHVAVQKQALIVHIYQNEEKTIAKA